MAKYHVNPASGNARECHAIYNCPFGGEEAHWDSKEAAAEAYEQAMATETFTSHRRESALAKLSDESLAENMGNFFTVDEIEFSRDWDRYGVEVYRGKLPEPNSDVELEIWANEGSVDAYVEMDGESVKVFTANLTDEDRPMGQDDDYGLITNRALASSVEQSIASAKDEYPEVFDRNSPAYESLLRIRKEVDSGSVTLNGQTLHDTGGVAPNIWETSEVDIPGVREVYMRERHGVASLRMVLTNDEVVSVYSEDVPEGNWSNSGRARFFARANDELIRATMDF